MRSSAPTAALVVDSRCTLGEGIVWCDQRRALLWTDIEGARLWMHVPSDGTTRSWTVPERVGSFALCASGSLLLGLAKGLGIANLDDNADTLAVSRIVDVEPGIDTRINDGRVDRSGNFVFGTLSEDFETPLASFYQYSSRHGLRRLEIERVIVSNSIGFSLDGGTMFFCDSPRRCIMQCDYDAETARVSGVRVFAEIASRGFPDGSTIDAEGNLWNAEWGAGIVRCYTPDGRAVRQVEVPTKNPSCVSFGGEKLDELFITTARMRMTAEELDSMPLAGGVYRAALENACGRPEERARGL